MAIPRESHSREIQAKNKSVDENAVTGLYGSCIIQVIGSWKGNFLPVSCHINFADHIKQKRFFDSWILMAKERGKRH